MSTTNPETTFKKLKIPGWLNTILAILSLLLFMLVIIYLGNLYEILVNLQISRFDGYFEEWTVFLTIIAYALILFICLLPYVIITQFLDRIYRKKAAREIIEMRNDFDRNVR